MNDADAGGLENVELALKLYLDDRKMKEVEAYARAGRRLKDLTDDELRITYIRSCQEWAVEFPKTGPGRLTFDNCQSEYAMRRQIEPRDAEVTAAVELVISKTQLVGHDLLADTERGRELRDDLNQDVIATIRGMLSKERTKQ